MTQMIAGGVKLGGNPDYAKALAAAALVPDIAALEERNRQLEEELLLRRRQQWRRNAEKIAAYKAGMIPPSHTELILNGIWLALERFWRLLVVKEG